MADNIGKDIGHFFGIPADVEEPAGLESTWSYQGNPDYRAYGTEMDTASAQYYADLQRALAARQAQEGLITQLQESAAGRGESVAQLMYEQRRQQALQDQASMASSARGMRSATSQRALTEQAAESQRKAILESAMLRLQEQRSAQQALAGVSQQMRGQDYTGAGLAGQMYGTQASAMGAQNQNRLGVEELKQKDAAQRAAAAMERYRLAVAQEAARAKAWGELGQNLLTGGSQAGALGQGLMGKKGKTTPDGSPAGSQTTAPSTTTDGGTSGDPVTGYAGSGEDGSWYESSDDMVSTESDAGETDWYSGDNGPLEGEDGYAQGGFVQGLSNFAPGGVVKGRARVRGNSPQNDTQPALMQPGQVVLPRTVAQSPNAPQKAKSFVQHLRCGGKVDGYAEGGDVTAGPAPVASDTPEVSSGTSYLRDVEARKRDDEWRRMRKELEDAGEMVPYAVSDDPLFYAYNAPSKVKDGGPRAQTWQEAVDYAGYTAARKSLDEYRKAQDTRYAGMTPEELQEIYRKGVYSNVNKSKASFLAQMNDPKWIAKNRRKEQAKISDDARWLSSRIADRDALVNALSSARRRDAETQTANSRAAGYAQMDESQARADQLRDQHVQQMSKVLGVTPPTQARMDTSDVPSAQLDEATQAKIREQNAYNQRGGPAPDTTNRQQALLNAAEKKREEPQPMADGGEVSPYAQVGTTLGDPNVPSPNGLPGMLTQTSSAQAPVPDDAANASRALALGDANVLAAQSSLKGALGYADGGEVDPSTGLPPAEMDTYQRPMSSGEATITNRARMAKEDEMEAITSRPQLAPLQPVNAVLSPGEIVVDRGTAKDPEKVKQFVAAIKKDDSPPEFAGVLAARSRAEQAAKQAAPADQQQSPEAKEFVERMASPDGQSVYDPRQDEVDAYIAKLQAAQNASQATEAAREMAHSTMDRGEKPRRNFMQALAAKYGYDTTYTDGVPTLHPRERNKQ